MKKTAIAALILALASSTYGLAETRSARLDYTPYSSSYLPFTQGPLTESTRQQLPNRELVDPVARAYAENTSVITRFDLARLRMLGHAQAIEKRYRDEFFRPNTESWEGVCNQWSAASLNPGIARLLEGNEGMYCNGAFFTRGELKELFTAFYGLWAGSEYYGERTGGIYETFGHPESSSPTAWRIRDRLGLDDLDAHVFHEQVYSHLARNEGIIMDFDPGPQVWNQPIFAADSLMSTISAEQVIANPYPYPFRVFEGHDAAASSLLANLSLIDQLAAKLVAGVPKDGREALISRIQLAFNTSLDLKNPDSFPNLRSTLIRDRLAPMIAAGRIAPSPAFTLKTVRTQIQYGKEVSFNVASEASRAATYEYVLIYQGDEPVSSIWVTPARSRPDSLMAGNRMSLPEASAEPDKNDSELRELVHLIRRCTPVKALTSFFAELDRALSGAPIDEEQKQALIARYRDVVAFANRDEIRARLRAHLGSGLTAAELGL